MKRKLIITLDEETTAMWFEMALRKTTAEVDADCLPSGSTLQIEICPPFGNTVFIGDGKDRVEIGEAEIEIIHEK